MSVSRHRTHRGPCRTRPRGPRAVAVSFEFLLSASFPESRAVARGCQLAVPRLTQGSKPDTEFHKVHTEFHKEDCWRYAQGFLTCAQMICARRNGLFSGQLCVHFVELRVRLAWIQLRSPCPGPYIPESF